MEQPWMRRKVAEARAVRVGTIDEQGRVHLVPVTFVVDVGTWYSPSDAGPRPAKRMRNLRADPRVTILIDSYAEDWSQVWWVRLRGHGRVVGSWSEHEHARDLLNEKYPQFAGAPSEEGAGPVMAVDVEEWSGWAYSA
jgi:PPOX class probable F420-dependent enzyme